MRRFSAGLVGTFMALAAPWVASAADALARLGAPGVHAIMRHALAPGFSDPANFALRDCATQRNLDGRGRAQARAAGDALRRAGARIDRVFSSQWCRCLETARLMEVGAVEEAHALNSFFEARHRREDQTAATLALLRGLPATETAFLVTHQVNIAVLTGAGAGSGDIVVFRLGEDGTITVLDRVTIPVP